MNKRGFVLDMFLSRHRATETAKYLLTRLPGKYDVSEVIHTDQLRSNGAAIPVLLSLVKNDNGQASSCVYVHGGSCSAQNSRNS